MEILISVSIVAIVIASVVGAILSSTSSNTNNRASQLATGYEQELTNNLRSVVSSNWYQIYNLPTKGSSGNYYLADYAQLPGTVGLNASSTTINGSGTNFTSSLVSGDSITVSSTIFTVSTITSDTQLTVTTAYTGSTTPTNLNVYRDFSIRSGKETITANNITFLRWFSVQNVYRDTCGTGTITTASTSACTVSSTGALIGVLEDPSTQEVTVYITWSGGLANGSYTVNQYFSRNKDQVIKFYDWSGGAVSDSSSVFTQPTNKYTSATGLITTTSGVLQSL